MVVCGGKHGWTWLETDCRSHSESILVRNRSATSQDPSAPFPEWPVTTISTNHTQARKMEVGAHISAALNPFLMVQASQFRGTNLFRHEVQSMVVLRISCSWTYSSMPSLEGNTRGQASLPSKSIVDMLQLKKCSQPTIQPNVYSFQRQEKKQRYQW